MRFQPMARAWWRRRESRSMGQTIWLQRQNRRAKYKVMWIGEPGTSLAGQVGVESLEPSNVIWEPEIKDPHHAFIARPRLKIW